MPIPALRRASPYRAAWPAGSLRVCKLVCVLTLLGPWDGFGSSRCVAHASDGAAHHPEQGKNAQVEPDGAPASTHSFVQTVQQYRRAVAQRDTAALRRLQAPGARVWFERREGEGRILDPAGKGPWADWDRYFRSRSEALEYVVEENAVRVTNREVNDWYRLIEREPLPYFIFYFLDAEGRIEGKLIQAIPGTASPPDRLPEFEAWAAKKYPGLLQELRPEGRIDPALEKARVWKEKLLEWRAAAGLPALDGEEP